MEEKTITIPVEEYKKLLAASVKIDIFSNFVKGSKYSIDREDCEKFFGFKVLEHGE